MRKERDWMSSSHEGLFNQASETVNYLTANVLARIGIAGVILTWYNNEFLVLWNIFKIAFQAWLNPDERTNMKSAALASAEKNFRKAYRTLYTGYMKSNPLVTNEDLTGAGMPVRHAGGGKPAPIPSTKITSVVNLPGPGRVGFHYRDETTKSDAKPDGVHGAEMLYGILDAPPTSLSQLTTSVFDTRTPLILDFPVEMSGRTLYYVMRWENTRGEKGPWNRINSVIIP
jgi:hypothetical protein